MEDQSHCILCDSFLSLVTLGVSVGQFELIIMQRPTREYKRITLKLTPPACIELHLALAANFNHWYLRWAVAVHPPQQLAIESRSLGL